MANTKQRHFGKLIHCVELDNAGNWYLSCSYCRLLLIFNHIGLLSSARLLLLGAKTDLYGSVSTCATVTGEAVAAVCELCRVLTAFSIVLLSRFVSDSPPARSESAIVQSYARNKL